MVISKSKILTKKNIIIFTIVVLLFLITIAVINISKNINEQKRLEKEQERVKQYTTLEDFKTMEEVALYLNSKFIKQETSEEDNIQDIVYIELSVKPVENEIANQGFYEKLIQYSAQVLKYNNFNIVDSKNKIIVTVVCDKTAQMVGTYYINGVQNYFEKLENKQNVEALNKVEEIEVTINSEDLKNIVNNQWKIDNINLGSAESIYKGYDIYFDEGIETRVIQKKFFNIIFNQKYNKKIVNDLTTSSTQEQIIAKLGEPQFKVGNLIGYKSKLMYIFFYNNQVSIYRNEEYDTEKIAQLIEQYNQDNNIVDFFNKVKEIWNDYDKYTNSKDNILLQYTLKGLALEFNSSSKNGIIIYNNYNGKICGDLTINDYSQDNEAFKNIYVENEDLVFKAETERINTQDSNSRTYNNPTVATTNTSNSFRIIATKVNENVYGIRFVSFDNKNPNSELRDYISKGIWLNENELIYSVLGRGIYVYNAKDRTYKTIVTGRDNFSIKKLENNTLYYDEVKIDL